MEMTFLIAVICLLAGLAAGIFALRPRAMKSLDVAVDVRDSSDRPEFTLSRSLLLIGPDMDDPVCREQRRELRRILNPLLEAEFKIIEIYGDLAPAENGEAYDWLDNQLLRKTLNAEEDFHLIHVNREGKTSFHSGRPITAEALLHIFDLWEYITEDAGEDLTNIVEEEPSGDTQTVPLTATPARQLPASAATAATTAAALNGTPAMPPLTAHLEPQTSEPPNDAPKADPAHTNDDWEGWTIHVNGMETDSDASEEEEISADPEEALVASLKGAAVSASPLTTVSCTTTDSTGPAMNGTPRLHNTDTEFIKSSTSNQDAGVTSLNGHGPGSYHKDNGRLSLGIKDEPTPAVSGDMDDDLSTDDNNDAEPMRRAPRSVSNAIRRRLDG
ncbi:MAG: hypothetical protein MRY59_09025 [Aquisalinus sp.]|nr:hypothetical protein [Aquisalinus sp.]